MNQQLTNNGIICLNKDTPSTNTDKTVIVLGVARSGTTMVASILKELGLFMGDSATGAVLEDACLAREIETGSIEAARKTIESYNGRHAIWVIKRPELYRHLAANLDLFRNPHIIATLRDPVAIARRNQISMQGDPVDQLLRASEETANLIAFLRAVQCPVMLASYEKSLADGPALLETICDFLGLTPSGSHKQKAIASIENGPEDYLKNTHIWFEGEFEAIERNEAKGWLRRFPRHKTTRIEILCGDEVIGEGETSPPQRLPSGEMSNPTFTIKLNKLPMGRSVTARVANTAFIIPQAKSFGVVT